MWRVFCSYRCMVQLKETMTYERSVVMNDDDNDDAPNVVAFPQPEEDGITRIIRCNDGRQHWSKDRLHTFLIQKEAAFHRREGKYHQRMMKLERQRWHWFFAGICVTLVVILFLIV